MRYQIVTIARFTVLEAWRTHLPWATVTVLIIAAGTSMFVKELAITESNRVAVAFLAGIGRIAVVLMVSLYIVSTMAREFNDRVTDLTLSLELPRASYVLGKLLGYGTVATGIALSAGMLLLPFAGGIGWLVWTSSLVLELWIVASLSLFCIVTFNQVMQAVGFVLAFYALARSIGAIQLISASPLLANGEATRSLTRTLLDIIAYLLPGLDRFTQTTWLVDSGANLNSLGLIVGQTAVYAALLTAASLFDFQRRNF